MIQMKEKKGPKDVSSIRKDYERESEQELTEWERRIADLRGEVHEVREELGEWSDNQMVAARRALIRARTRLDTLKDVGEDVWDDLRGKTDDAMVELRQAWERLIGRIR